MSDKAKAKKVADPEWLLMRHIQTRLEELTLAAARRVLAWVADKHREREEKEAAEKGQAVPAAPAVCNHPKL